MAKNDSFKVRTQELSHQTPEYLETLFAVGNGQIGVRAGHPLKVNELYEGNPGSFVNGFFDSEPIQYGEWAYGYAKEHQTIIKLPNLRGVRLQIGDEDSSASEWQVKPIQMTLDLEKGVLDESYKVVTPLGKTFELVMQSFASVTRSELYVCQYQIKNTNFSEPISMTHPLEQKAAIVQTDDPRVASKAHHLRKADYQDYAIWTAENSQRSIAIRVINGEKQLQAEETLTTVFQMKLLEDNQNHETPFNQEFADFEVLLQEQQQSYQQFWAASDIQIEGDPVLQKGIRFNLFHLNQGAGRDGRTNFAAKGLTGEGYEGHYFWDTEMYLLPFFIFTNPEIAKALLSYRGKILPQAKQRAQELSQEGALFAWRTIDGNETSAYYPAGTAQVHINADIVYAFQLYERVTGDQAFIETVGSEVVFETAKFWLSYGDLVEKEGKLAFCINGVTGPDEYSALVNNNFYTNKIVQNNLYYAIELAQRYGKYQETISAWQQAADLMYFGYDEQRGITKQDDGFLEQAVWPFETTPAEKYPLLLHYHPMVIYKHQVCKQADTVLAQMLYTGDFSLEQLKKDYDYYEQVTTHDSSLSRSIFSVMASRIGDSEKAYRYFMDTALMDLTDLQKNVVDGIHAANMGGSWLSLIYGFAGLYYDQGLRLANHLPQKIKELKFTLFYQGEPVKISLKDRHIDCQLAETTQLLATKTDGGIWIKER